MRCFFNDEIGLVTGLQQHGFLKEYGTSIRNNGASTTCFGERWKESAILDRVRKTDKPYYFDRITGGFQFQSLDGIQDVIKNLENDDNFMGFQAHEWGHSPLCDYNRINEFFIKKEIDFNQANFAEYEGRIDYPFFSGGNYEVYKDLYRPLHSAADARSYLKDYFSAHVEKTNGKLVAVNGTAHGYHTALQLGAENIMAEIGGQIKLIALQLAFARGAAKQYGKEFGFYYEPWGSKPVSASCAVGFSLWYNDRKPVDNRFMGSRAGIGFGSSRALHKRLLYFAWLAGATYCAEEWGAENYFSNWTDYPLTEYGKVMKDFIDQTSRLSSPKPIVPAAVVFPEELLPLDANGIIGGTKIFKGQDPEPIYSTLQRFAEEFLSANQEGDHESDNLTSSPWLGAFDFFTESAPPHKLEQYSCVVYLDRDQFNASPLSTDKKILYPGRSKETSVITNRLQSALPFHVGGEIGSIQSTCDDSYLLALFNNHGASINDQKTVIDATQKRSCQVKGNVSSYNILKGQESYCSSTKDSLEFDIPAGEFVLIQF